MRCCGFYYVHVIGQMDLKFVFKCDLSGFHMNAFFCKIFFVVRNPLKIGIRMNCDDKTN